MLNEENPTKITSFKFVKLIFKTFWKQFFLCWFFIVLQMFFKGSMGYITERIIESVKEKNKQEAFNYGIVIFCFMIGDAYFWNASMLQLQLTNVKLRLSIVDMLYDKVLKLSMF